MRKITLTDLLIEKAKRERKYFKNYLKYAKIIKKEAKKLLGKVKVFVFGSILKKREIPQDIDILIISPKLKTPKEKILIQVKILKKIGFSSPFEIHLITPYEYKNWYRFFIKEKIEV